MVKMLHDDITGGGGKRKSQRKQQLKDLNPSAQDISGQRQTRLSPPGPNPADVEGYYPNNAQTNARPVGQGSYQDPAQTQRVPISGRVDRFEPPLNEPSGPPALYGWDQIGSTAAPPRYVSDGNGGGQGNGGGNGVSHQSIARAIPGAKDDIAGPMRWPLGGSLEAGVPGTGIFSGFISAGTTGEFNPDLYGWNAMRVYEQMRRTDADVAVALFAMKLPLFSVVPEIVPGDTNGGGNGNLAKEISDFVKENLMGGLERQIGPRWVSQPFNDVKENAFLMLDFGCAAHENLWRVDGNRIRLRYCAPRLPHTFYRFWTAEDGETLTGLEQLGYRRERYISTTVPAHNICLFTNRREGANFYGISALRPAYQHWYVKSNFYRIDAMAMEKNGMGVPWIKFPPGSKREDVANAQQFVQELAVSERTGLALPDGYEFEIAGLKGRLRDPINSIKHHSQEIVRSVMAMFIALGTTETGSRALASTLLDLFRQSLQHYATVFCSTFNDQTIKPLVDLNYTTRNGNRLPYPSLAFPSIVVIDPVETAEVIQKLGQSQVDIIRPSLELEQALLQKFGLPYGPARTKFAPTMTQVRIMAEPSGDETVGAIERSQVPVQPQEKGGGGDQPSNGKGPAQAPRPRPPVGKVASTGQGDEFATRGKGIDIHDMVNEIVAGHHGTTLAKKDGKDGGDTHKTSPTKYKFTDLRDFQGIPIAIENDRGTTRSGMDEDGVGWEVEMSRPYGYIQGVIGLDNEELDCFVGPYRKAKNVYLIATKHPQGGVKDEEKVMLGFRSASEAKNTFLKNYSSPDYFHGMRTLPLKRFKEWMGMMGGKIQMHDGPPEVGFDLDGSLAEHVTPFDANQVGPPRPLAIEKVKRLQAMGYRVWIFTARTDLGPVIQWSLDHHLNLQVTNRKRPQFVAIIDDRAVGVNEGVEETVRDVEKLHKSVLRPR